MSKELTTEMLEELRTQITSYFEAYYSALRNEIAGHDALYDSIPHYFKGQREVVTNFCRDGVVIVHGPAETEEGFLCFRVGPRYSGRRCGSQIHSHPPKRRERDHNRLLAIRRLRNFQSHRAAATGGERPDLRIRVDPHGHGELEQSRRVARQTSGAWTSQKRPTLLPRGTLRGNFPRRPLFRSGRPCA